MENSVIYDLLDFKLVSKWRNEIEADDESGYEAKMRENAQKICALLNDEQKILLNDYAMSIRDHFDSVYYLICIRTLNFGIKAGMELQAAFNKTEN